MKLHVELDLNDREKTVKNLLLLMALLSPNVGEGSGEREEKSVTDIADLKKDITDEKPKRTRKTKAKAKQEEEEEEEFSLDAGLSDDDGPSLDLGDDDDEEETLSLEDVISAIRGYAKKHGPDRAKAILTKMKVKSVKDLNESQYKRVMSLVGV